MFYSLEAEHVDSLDTLFLLYSHEHNKAVVESTMWIRKAYDGRHISGMSLHRGLERLFHEALKVKPGLTCSPQRVKDDKAVGYLLLRAVKGEWIQPKSKKNVTVN